MIQTSLESILNSSEHPESPLLLPVVLTTLLHRSFSFSVSTLSTTETLQQYAIHPSMFPSSTARSVGISFFQSRPRRADASTLVFPHENGPVQIMHRERCRTDPPVNLTLQSFLTCEQDPRYLNSSIWSRSTPPTHGEQTTINVVT